MGKGSNTTTTNQSQTYNPAGAGYVTGALDKAQSAANLPFAIPQAPVAGFSPQQQQAFNLVGNAQGQAQPYYNQASNLFNQSTQTPDVSQFFNPMAGAVTAQMNNIFGQQQSQNNANLVQSAGGVGADRIAVGQGNLANQQGLAAGQTLAGLYQPAMAAAQQQQSLQQGAAYGQAAVGSQAQNAALSGANALLGTGGLQQQLSQAQLNAPYQQQLAQAAFPYQQASFLSGITGALAPGLGGTTSGQGTTTGPAPSMLSQILGLGTAAAGAAGGTGMFGPSGSMNPKGSSPSFGGGNMFSGDAWGGSASNPLPGLSAGDYGATGGRVAAYAPGGAVDEDEGGGGGPYQLPPGFNDKPINVAEHSIIPQVQQSAIQPNMPKLDLNPKQPSGGGGGGPGVADIAKLAMMFVKDGGRIPGRYAEGGEIDDVTPASFDERFPYRMATPEGMDAWRRGNPTSEEDTPSTALSLSGPDSTAAFPPPRGAHGRGAGTFATAPAPSAAQDVGAGSAAPAAAPAAAPEGKEGRFIDSPWAALMAAGLGIAGGTSPFPMVNIGQGGLQGMKTLETQRTAGQHDETIAQAAKRLELEAKHHEDQYTRMTPYQQAQIGIHETAAAREDMKPVKVGVDLLGRDIMARRNPKTGQYINTLTGKPVEETPNTLQVSPQYKPPGPQSENDPAALPPHARLTQGFNAPEGVNPEILAQYPPQRAATIRAIDEGRQSLTSVPVKDRQAVIDALNAYDPNWDQSVWTLRNQQQREMSTNGNSGKMILAVNQLLPHLKTLSDRALALDNSKYPAANTIANWWATNTGDPRVKKFESVREVAAMDAARLLRGSGQMAEQDINFWRNNIGASGSPAQLQENIEQLASDLMGARISSIQHSYRTNMRMEPPDFISKEAKEALQTIKGRIAKPEASGAAPAVPAAAAAPAVAPVAAKPLQVGEERTNPHGVKGRWNGTGWEVIH